MLFKPEKSAPLIFILALLLLALIGVGVYQSFRDTQTLLALENHTQESLLVLQKLQISLVNIETGVRGYVLSGDESFLEPYNKGTKQFQENLDQLRQLTADDDLQKGRVEVLQRLGNDKILVSQKFINLRRTAGFQDALNSIKTREGQVIMEQIRAQADEFEQAELLHLKGRKESLHAQIIRARFIILTGSTLGIISLVYTNLMIVRQLRRRKITENALAEANLLLENRVAAQMEDLTNSSGELKLENIRRAVAEKKERNQREWWRVTLESIDDCVITTDIEGKINFINKKAQQVTGWTAEDAEELPLENVFKIVHEKNREAIENPLVKILEGGVGGNFATDVSLLTKDGRYLPIYDSGAAIRDDDGIIIGTVLVFRDFSQQRQAELQLSTIEEQQRLALAAGKMGSFAWDLQSNNIQTDDRVRELFGISKDESVVTIDPFFAVIHEDDRSALDANIRAAIELKNPYDSRFRIKLPNGKIRWIAGMGKAEIDGAGKPRLLRGINYDITDQVEAEEQLRDSEERYRLVAESASDAIIIIDNSSTILFINRAAERIFGYKIEAMIGQSLTMLMPEYLRHLHEAGISRYEATGKQHLNWNHLEIPGLHQDGHEIPLELSFSESNIQGKHIYVGIARDVSERRQAEIERSELLEREKLLRSKAEESNRLKDEFVATVSHELRTPLNAILGWARMMRAGNLDAVTTGKALETIERSAENQARLIDDLLDISRIVTGKLRLEVRTIDPALFVQAAMETVKPAANAKNITINAVIDQDVNSIAGDANRLQQVAWNLLSNAIKFTPKDGSINVRLSRDESHIIFEVRDTGQGISPDFLPYVFDRFRQADATSIRKHGGLGLGLAIVRHLVELHGGLISVESEGLNQGSSFTVRLPIKALRLPVSEETTQILVQPSEIKDTLSLLSAEPILKGLCILTVDDENDALQLLKQMLTTYGATVISASTAASALAIIIQQKPDLLVSDIGMPEEDGYSLIRKIRELEQGQLSRMPAIALTAYARPHDRMQALSSGFNHHVPKPVEPAELITVIASLTGRLNLDLV